MATQLDKPVCLLTFDTELLWGIRFMGWSDDDLQAARRVRDHVFADLLKILDDLSIKATFAIVGHLLVRPGERPKLPPTANAPAVDRWYSSIHTDFERAPEGFYWPELPQLLRQARTQHEIGLHTFSHWHFESEETDSTIAEFEIETNRRCLREANLSPSDSLIFPRNHPGQLDTLRALGVNCYRGLDQNWYSRLPAQMTGPGHLADCLGRMAPPVYPAVETEARPMNIPGSYLFWGTEGVRRRIPMSCRVAQARKGLRQAVRRNAIFHLWMHPINLAHHPELMLPALRETLETAAQLRDRGDLRIVTMSEAVDLLT